MSSHLSSIRARIRALLAKTTASGCTEAEALAAAAKARELLETYQLSLSSLEIEEEGVLLREVPADPRSAAVVGLSKAIAFYCDCRAARSYPSGKSVKFLGLRSDTDLATWLLSSLETFVIAEALAWTFDQPSSITTTEVDSFVVGAYRRISLRLHERASPTSSSNALITLKNSLIEKSPEIAGFRPAPRVNWGIRANPLSAAFAAGQEAGERANFARPLRGAAPALPSPSKD